MASEISKRDPNRVPALIIHNSDGTETRQVRASATNPNAIPVEVIDSVPDVVATTNTPTIATAATALAANTSRKSWTIQNVGTNTLYVRLAASASDTVYHAALHGGSADSDGRGASLEETSGAIYTGIITVAGTSPKYVVTEET